MKTITTMLAIVFSIVLSAQTPQHTKYSINAGSYRGVGYPLGFADTTLYEAKFRSCPYHFAYNDGTTVLDTIGTLTYTPVVVSGKKVRSYTYYCGNKVWSNSLGKYVGQGNWEGVDSLVADIYYKGTNTLATTQTGSCVLTIGFPPSFTNGKGLGAAQAYNLTSPALKFVPNYMKFSANNGNIYITAEVLNDSTHQGDPRDSLGVYGSHPTIYAFNYKKVLYMIANPSNMPTSSLDWMAILSNLAYGNADKNALLGTRTILVTINGVRFTQDITVSPSVSTGIEIMDSKASISHLYPNPTTDLLQISSEVKGDKIAISVYDLTGQLVQEQQFENNGSTHEISLGSLSNGTYIVRVNSGKGQLVTKQ